MNRASICLTLSSSFYQIYSAGRLIRTTPDAYLTSNTMYSSDRRRRCCVTNELEIKRLRQQLVDKDRTIIELRNTITKRDDTIATLTNLAGSLASGSTYGRGSVTPYFAHQHNKELTSRRDQNTRASEDIGRQSRPSVHSGVSRGTLFSHEDAATCHQEASRFESPPPRPCFDIRASNKRKQQDSPVRKQTPPPAKAYSASRAKELSPSLLAFMASMLLLRKASEGVRQKYGTPLRKTPPELSLQH